MIDLLLTILATILFGASITAGVHTWREERDLVIALAATVISLIAGALVLAAAIGVGALWVVVLG